MKDYLEKIKGLDLNNSAFDLARSPLDALGLNKSVLKSARASLDLLGADNAAFELARSSVYPVDALGLNKSAFESARASLDFLDIDNPAFDLARASVDSVGVLGLNKSVFDSARASLDLLGIDNPAFDLARASIDSVGVLGLNKSIFEPTRASMDVLGLDNSVFDLARASINSIDVLGLNNPLLTSLKHLDIENPLLHTIKALQLTDPLKEFRRSIDAIDSLSSINNVFNTISETRWESDTDIQITEDGTISIGLNSIDQQKLQEFAIEVLEKSFNGISSQIESQLENVIKEINSLKDPFLQKVMIWLIYPIIVGLVLSVVTPITDFYIKRELNSGEKRAVVKKVKQSIVSNIANKSVLTTFRIVSANTLNVRQSGSRKSEIIGQLHIGYIVEVLNKERKWSLVIWHDKNTNTSIQGWVFSRYIKAIR